MQTENSKLATAAQWAGVLLLVSLAVAINGGANFYGGYILATELGMSHAAGYAVGSALAIVTLFLLGAYLTGKRGLPVIYLHIFSGCLLMFDVMHLAQMSVNAVSSANGNITQLEAEIADIDYQIGTAEKELSGLAATVTGNNIQSLTAQINALKNTAVEGGALWTVSAGCTAGGYRTKCRHIEILQGNLDAEIAAVSGAEVTKKREEITKLRGMKTEKQGMKQGMSQKSDSAGFIAKMKPETWSVNGFLLAISMPFAVSFELFSVLAFGMLKNKLTPQKPLNREIRGTHQGHGIREWLRAWDETLKNSVVQSANVYAEKKAIEEVTRNEELNTKIADVERKGIKLSGDVSAYIKILCPDEIGRIMDKNSVESLASQDKKARLKNSVHAAMMLFAENERLPQSGDNATWKLTNDAQKHFRLRTLPALIKIGMVSKDSSGAHWWVSASDAWAALGEPVLAANHSAAKTKDESDNNPIADGRPVRRRPHLRVVEVLSHKQQ